MIEELTNEAAFKAMSQHSPKLLQLIEIFVKNGYTSDQIVTICADRSGQPSERLAFIGCAADHLIAGLKAK